ncbi:exodeoxyribonuclease VII large subunit [Aliihoeflea sp. PC F10.4]
MSDSEASDSRTNASEYSVSEISGALKRVVEDTFGNVRVRGEISGYRGPHSSGHAYFSLKDDRARIEAVVWKGTFSKLRFRPEEGMEVIASGKLTTYPGSSKYQIVIDNIEPAGAGALMALLEERKRRLAAEGLFEAERKRPLPFMPRTIGVITSPTGAVIRDIIHRITDRFPVHVVVWPVRVQGETTGAEVSNAIAGFNALPEGMARPDLLIVARGGGSLEDLWGFNDEAVVRAVAASQIPVISAVGHETDWTLIDLVADRRAPTPTGAAEMAVPVKAELEAAVSRFSARLKGSVSRSTQRKRDTLRAAARALPSADALLALPRRRFDEAASRLQRALIANTEAKKLRFRGLRLSPGILLRRISDAGLRAGRAANRLPVSFEAMVVNRRNRLARDASRVTPTALMRRIEMGRQRVENSERRQRQSIDRAIERRRQRFEQAARLAGSLSYTKILERGFAVVLDAQDQLVKRAAEVSTGDAVSIRFADGDVAAITAQDAAARPKAKPKTSSGPAGQGTLF